MYARVEDHEKRLNNTTTDELYNAILEVMKARYNKEYPDLVNWAGSVQEIKAVHNRDVEQLRTDVTSVNLRVETHEDAVRKGQEKFTEIAQGFRAIEQDVLRLWGAQQNALRRAFDNAYS